MNRPPYSAIAVANWFVTRQCRDLTPLKLQKLIYYAHGWHLALKGKPLIDEVVQAWQYGPVVPSVYREFKVYGSDTIPREALGTDWEPDDDGQIATVVPQIPSDDLDTERFLEKIVEVFGGSSGAQLSTSTHQPGTPWFAIKQRDANRKSVPIPNEEIRKYFLEVAQRSQPHA